jgi:hypothetical protein
MDTHLNDKAKRIKKKKNQTLNPTRDTLLPKLTGEVD